MSDKFSFRLFFLFSFAVCSLLPFNLAASERTEGFTGLFAPETWVKTGEKNVTFSVAMLSDRVELDSNSKGTKVAITHKAPADGFVSFSYAANLQDPIHCPVTFSVGDDVHTFNQLTGDIMYPVKASEKFSIALGSANNSSCTKFWIMKSTLAISDFVFAPQVFTPQLTSYSQIDLSEQVPVVTQANGSSPITNFGVADMSGAVYRDTYKTWGLDEVNGTGLSFTLELSHPTMVQLGLRTAAALVDKKSNNPLQITVNGNDLFNEAHTDTNDHWHQIFWNIPQALLKNGANTIDIKLAASATSQYFVQQAIVTPQKIYAQDGVINTTLFAQFGETTTITGAKNTDDSSSNVMWTRGYGLTKDMMMIPAPTFYFQPGDYLGVGLSNQLNRNTSTRLNNFENAESKNMNGSPDETLDNVSDKLRHEVNIPHNLDNTNLHVHGLHVDPEKDDVTIVIVPEGESNAGYDAPAHLPRTKADLAGLNEGSVADQSVKAGSWDYQYRIPSLHLPGTHWYHPHKHGSTAAQVENGMAGSIVIQESAGNAVVPYPGTTGTVKGGAAQTDYDRTSWEDNHDRVLMIQEIANYGTQKGGADGGGQNSKNPDITINGQHQPTFKLASGQLQRWRMVNAGANHLAFSHIWLGKKISGGTHPVYQSTPIYLVAVDGITLKEKVEITAQNPLLLAPGNRADILVQLSDAGDYTLYKYFPDTISVLDTDGNLIWNCATTTSTDHCSGALSAAAAPTSNPYLFKQTGVNASSINKGKQTANFAGFNRNWNGQSEQSIMPLIKVKSDASGNYLDLDFALSADAPNEKGELQSKGKWQPQAGSLSGGGNQPTVLFNINVSNNPPKHVSPNMPSDAYLSGVHLVNNLGETPAYVSKIKDTDILQSRPVVFDMSGAMVNVVGEGKDNQVSVKQFTLNGRPFALNDPIGNSTDIVNGRLQDGVANTSSAIKKVISGTTKHPVTGQDCINKTVLANGDIECELNIAETLSFKSATTNWTNEVNGEFFWSNPGYYQSINYDAKKGFLFSADQSGEGKYPQPSWSDLTGVATPAVVNKTHAKHSKIEGIPGLPVATTAEEWILINNSDIGHPFHIHINPFFVTEVGQLSYEQFSDKKEWIMRATSIKDLPTITSADPAPTKPAIYEGNSLVPSFVGNWWDTAIVPPHGYVKLRYWFNVPNQTGVGSAATVVDDFNKQGIWVFHCHILRHEDRGMMMPVITQEKVCTKQ